MEHTKGELEIFISKYGFHKICRKDGIGHKDILGDVSSEEAIANFQELVRRWNAFEKDGLVDRLLTTLQRISDIEDERYKHGGFDLEVNNIAKAAIAKVT